MSLDLAYSADVAQDCRPGRAGQLRSAVCEWGCSCVSFAHQRLGWTGPEAGSVYCNPHRQKIARLSAEHPQGASPRTDACTSDWVTAVSGSTKRCFTAMHFAARPRRWHMSTCRRVLFNIAGPRRTAPRTNSMYPRKQRMLRDAEDEAQCLKPEMSGKYNWRQTAPRGLR
jgi:hypothetical protein